MASHSSIRTMMSPLLASFRSLSLTPAPNALPRTISSLRSQHAIRAFSTSPTLSLRPSKEKKGGKKGGPKKGDPRISLIRYHMQHPETPRPLRFSRNRSLRHWTIHRAWMLARRKKLEAEEMELQRMYQSIHSACEELRNLDAPGTKDAGRLYRIAMEKKGIFGHGGVPIEYARLQTDTPGPDAWYHGWTR